MSEPADEIEALLESLDDPDKAVIRKAADSLIALAKRFPEVEKRLDRLLRDPSRKNRWPIAYILGHLPHPSGATFKILIETLDNTDPDIRWAMGLLLVRLGKSRPETFSLLVNVLRAGTPTQRRMGVYCLRDMELKDPISLQALLAALRDPEPLVRVAAVTSLSRRPEIGREEKSFLLELFLNDPDSRVRYSTAMTLAQLGEPSGTFLQALTKARESEDPHLRKVADGALQLLQKKGSVPTGN